MFTELRLPRGTAFVTEVEVASGPLTRVRGLIGRPPPREGCALVFPRAKQVHTCGMSYPIDVVFLDAGLQVIHVSRAMRPWRVSRFVPRARFALELRAGGADLVNVGDRLLTTDL